MKKFETLSEKEKSAIIEKYLEKAKNLLADDKKFGKFFADVEEKFKKISSSEMFQRIPAMVSMLKSYCKKEYTAVPKYTIVAVVACLIYWLNPADLIPDIVPILGYSDDMAFFTVLCAGGVDADIKKYNEWKANLEQKK